MIILASESPRRKELLRRIVPEFITVPPCVEELEEGATLEELPEKNALLKAEAVAKRFPGDWVIGSDTAVFAEGKMLGKPASLPEAEEMLAMLGGKTHQVISGVALVCREKGVTCSWSCVSQVTFKALNSEEIKTYMKHVSVLDKAGAYAIQAHPELLGARFEGELENIIGLPLVKLEEVLKEFELLNTTSGA